MSDKDALLATLKELNAEVDAVLAKRTGWMDAHIADFARYQIGEEIYDVDTGRRLGIVSKHYRYWADDNPLYDTHMSVQYEYKKSDTNGHDNTSRQPGLSICNRDEMIERHKQRAEYLASLGPDGKPDWERIFNKTYGEKP